MAVVATAKGDSRGGIGGDGGSEEVAFGVGGGHGAVSSAWDRSGRRGEVRWGGWRQRRERRHRLPKVDR